MVVENLKTFLVFYLAILGLVIFLRIKYRDKFWHVFGSLLLPLILAGLFLYNIISYPAINLFAVFPSYQGPLRRLSSNEMITLIDSGTTKARVDWIYPLIEIYYQGRTLLVPDDLIDTTNLSLTLLQSQGQLADVREVEQEGKLTDGVQALILEIDFAAIRMDDGNVYHFVTEETDPSIPLLLLKNGNQFFFLPTNLLPDREVGQ